MNITGSRNVAKCSGRSRKGGEKIRFVAAAAAAQRERES